MSNVDILLFRGQQPNEEQCKKAGENIYVNWNRVDINALKKDLTEGARIIEIRAPIKRILIRGDKVLMP